jgi:hypothetical protein
MKPIRHATPRYQLPIQLLPCCAAVVDGCLLQWLVAADAHKSGVAQEAVNKAVKTASGMSTQEARMILSVDPQASWLDVTKVSNTSTCYMT